MKSLLLSAAVMTVLLTACDKKPSAPMKPTVQPSSQSAPVSSLPIGEVSKEDKEKALEAAKAVAKSAASKE